jgi:hypothetical protein
VNVAALLARAVGMGAAHGAGKQRRYIHKWYNFIQRWLSSKGCVTDQFDLAYIPPIAKYGKVI